MFLLSSRFLLLTALLLVSPAWAQTETSVATANTDNTSAPRWLVACNNRSNPALLSCSMSQSVIQNESRQRILTASIFKDTQGGYFMRLLLPHGLDITQGVSLNIDEGSPVKHTINTADVNGSYARIPLEPELIAAMKSGNIIVVGVNSASGAGINLQLSLTGFSTAFDLFNQ